MNELIQQMIYKFNEEVGVQWINEDKVKFAELIVRECVKILRQEESTRKWLTPLELSKCESLLSIVQTHFGVK